MPNVGHSTDIRQAFRRGFFTNYDIIVFAHIPISFGNFFFLLLRLQWLLDTLSFPFYYPESAAKWILKVLWVPNIPFGDAKAFWCCDIVAVCYRR
jgi:hypothetical protein